MSFKDDGERGWVATGFTGSSVPEVKRVVSCICGWLFG